MTQVHYPLAGRIVRRYGFKSRNQLPLFMVWDEHRHSGDVVYATVVFSTSYLRSFWWWKCQAKAMSHLHGLRKLASTLRCIANLAGARTFGRYLHNAYNGEIEYAVYRWRGNDWAFPLGPMDPRK